MLLELQSCSIAEMANTSSAKKAKRAALRRGVFNARRKKTMKDAVKDVSKLLNEKNAQKAIALLPSVQQAIDKAVKRGVIKANAAARMKSRVAKRLKALVG